MKFITAGVLLFLMSFPRSIWQGGISLREKKLKQAKRLEDTEQATCASPASQSKGHLVEKADCTGKVNQRLVLLGELQLVPLFRGKESMKVPGPGRVKAFLTWDM